MSDTTLAPVVEQIILLMAQCVHAFVNKPEGKQANSKKAGDYADEVANLLSEAKKTIDSIQYTIIAGKYAELLETFEELEGKMGKKFAKIRYHQDARKLKAKIRRHIREIKAATIHADALGPGGFNPYLTTHAETVAFAEKLKMEVIKDVSLGYLRRNGHKASHGVAVLQAASLGVLGAFMGGEDSVLCPEFVQNERRVSPIDEYQMIFIDVGPGSYACGAGQDVGPQAHVPFPTPWVMPHPFATGSPGINMPEPHYPQPH